MGFLISQAKVGSILKNYYELTKPKIWYLLVFTAFASALTASLLFHIGVQPLTWVFLIGGVAAGSAAADALTGYNDRDIDAIMDRTKARPIPSGRISPRNALIFGLVLAQFLWYFHGSSIYGLSFLWFLDYLTILWYTVCG